MRKKRVTYRPGKTAGAFGVIWGSIFILIGGFVVIPTFGPFGILWTLMAVGITAYNGYCAFGKGYVGPEISIEDDTSPTGGIRDTEQRLQELQSLYDRSLITQEEYEEKRKEILKEL